LHSVGGCGGRNSGACQRGNGLCGGSCGRLGWTDTGLWRAGCGLFSCFKWAGWACGYSRRKHGGGSQQGACWFSKHQSGNLKILVHGRINLIQDLRCTGSINFSGLHGGQHPKGISRLDLAVLFKAVHNEDLAVRVKDDSHLAIVIDRFSHYCFHSDPDLFIGPRCFQYQNRAPVQMKHGFILVLRQVCAANQLDDGGVFSGSIQVQEIISRQVDGNQTLVGFQRSLGVKENTAPTFKIGIGGLIQYFSIHKISRTGVWGR